MHDAYGISDGAILAMTGEPGEPGALFDAAAIVEIKSTDGGETWRPVCILTRSQYRDMCKPGRPFFVGLYDDVCPSCEEYSAAGEVLRSIVRSGYHGEEWRSEWRPLAIDGDIMRAAGEFERDVIARARGTVRVIGTGPHTCLTWRAGGEECTFDAVACEF